MAQKNPETVVVSGFSEPISFSVRNVGCGGRTRTYDLRVMSPTSFQLLYSAIWGAPLVPEYYSTAYPICQPIISPQLSPGIDICPDYCTGTVLCCIRAKKHSEKVRISIDKYTNKYYYKIRSQILYLIVYFYGRNLYG